MKNKKSPLKFVGAAMGVGVNSQPANIIDATSQFDPNAQAAMQGIYGDITGRQTSLGASGIYALNKHLSPVKNKDEKDLYTKEQWHAVNSVTDAAIKKGAGAYIEVRKGDSYEDPNYYDNLSSEELESKFPKKGDKINKNN